MSTYEDEDQRPTRQEAEADEARAREEEAAAWDEIARDLREESA